MEQNDNKTVLQVQVTACSIDNTCQTLLKCMLCSINMASWSIARREQHVNNCLDKMELKGNLETSQQLLQQEPKASIKTNTLQIEKKSHQILDLSHSSVDEKKRSVNAFDILMKKSNTNKEIIPQAKASNDGARKRQIPSTWSEVKARSVKISPPTRTYKSKCPDFKIIEGTNPPFVVDGFQYASNKLSSIYFLTHFHSDHYIGLDKSFNYGIIYCNRVTAALVQQELGIDSKYIHVLPMDEKYAIHGVQVTLMDANHCPGAAIILFQLQSGKVYLHTGDFRFHKKMVNYPAIKSYFTRNDCKKESQVAMRFDGVYLDTTYANPKYCFPTQDASIQCTLQLMEMYCTEKHDDKTLYLFGSYSIGKERLFMEVGRKFNRKICVTPTKLKFIQTYGWSDCDLALITTEPSDTNLHVVPMHDLKMENLENLLTSYSGHFEQIIAYRPTGWTFSKSTSSTNLQSMATSRTNLNGNIRVYGIPYSEHSSFHELCEFIKLTDPHNIIPTVNCSSANQVSKQINIIRQSAFHSITNFTTSIFE